MFYQRIKTEVIQMFIKWDPFIIEMENKKSHPLSWRGIMTMLTRVMMISLSLLLIFYRPHLLSCAAHCGDFHVFTPFISHHCREISQSIFILWITSLYNAMGEYSRFISLFAVVCTMTTPQTHQCGVLFWSFLSRSLLPVFICSCLCLYLHFWTNPISSVCASALIWWH